MKKRQVIGMVKDHPEVIKIWDELDELKKQLMQQLDFMEKRTLKMVADSEPKRKEIWTRIEDYCESRGLLPPEYSRSGSNMSVDKDLGVISVGPKDDCGHDHGSGGRQLLGRGEIPKELAMMLMKAMTGGTPPEGDTK